MAAAEALLVASGTGVITSSGGSDPLTFDLFSGMEVCRACCVLFIDFVFLLRLVGFADSSRDPALFCVDCSANLAVNFPSGPDVMFSTTSGNASLAGRRGA